MAENRRSAKGQLRKDYQDLAENGVLGDWCFEREDKYIVIRLPDSETTERGSATGFPIHPDIHSKGVEPGTYWEWDGNKEAPTLQPSLHWIGVWHGWMRAGEIISV